MAASVEALPVVRPVPFALVGEDLVFPVLPGDNLEEAVRGAVVAFETDLIDPIEGWSVVVTGVASSGSATGISFRRR